MAAARSGPVQVVDEAASERRAEEVVKEHIAVGHVPVERQVAAVVIAHGLLAIDAAQPLSQNKSVHVAAAQITAGPPLPWGPVAPWTIVPLEPAHPRPPPLGPGTEPHTPPAVP